MTPFHAKYYAYELTLRRPPGSDERLASALADAQVDLNPHQIDAALFAFRSPLSRGVLLADEVGLGKTIEAGLVTPAFFRKGASESLRNTSVTFTHCGRCSSHHGQCVRMFEIEEDLDGLLPAADLNGLAPNHSRK